MNDGWKDPWGRIWKIRRPTYLDPEGVPLCEDCRNGKTVAFEACTSCGKPLCRTCCRGGRCWECIP